MVPLNRHPGFVLHVDDNEIDVQLRVGGVIRCKNPKNFKIGNRVALVFNHAHTKVLKVYPLEYANSAVRSSVDPIYDAAIREVEHTLTEEEEIQNGDKTRESTDIISNPWYDITFD